MDREAWGTAVHRVAKTQTGMMQFSTHTHTYTLSQRRASIVHAFFTITSSLS